MKKQKKYYTVLFKNGSEIEIPESIFKILYESIPKGVSQFQGFKGEDGKMITINLVEVSAIHLKDKKSDFKFSLNFLLIFVLGAIAGVLLEHLLK